MLLNSTVAFRPYAGRHNHPEDRDAAKQHEAVAAYANWPPRDFEPDALGPGEILRPFQGPMRRQHRIRQDAVG